MIIIGSLLIIALVFIFIGHNKGADIIISPIKGMMFGFLYHKEQYEEGNEYTLQTVIGIISITVIWINQVNGSE